MKPKTDNRPKALNAKIELRERALAYVGEAHVLDAFCGEGVLHDAVWWRAASYVGIDRRLCWPSPIKRFCGDTPRILRAIDLQPYNVFDLDTYGGPWVSSLVIADRRSWAEGEKGALVLTSGAAAHTRYGALGKGLRDLLGRKTLQIPCGLGHSDDLHRWAVQSWLARAQVTLVDLWNAVSGSEARKGGVAPGSTRMIYTTLTFVGQGKPPRNRQVTLPYEERPERCYRRLARAAVRNAMRRGEMKPQPCERGPAGCSGPIHAHHHSYDRKRWLDVAWLCHFHHLQVHHEQA